MSIKAFDQIPGFLKFVMKYTYKNEERYAAMSEDDVNDYKITLEEKWKDIIAKNYYLQCDKDEDRTQLLEHYTYGIHNMEFTMSEDLYSYVREYIAALKREVQLRDENFPGEFQKRMKGSLSTAISKIKDKKEKRKMKQLEGKITTSYDPETDAYYYHCPVTCSLGKIRADVKDARTGNLDVKSQNFLAHCIRFHMK